MALKIISTANMSAHLSLVCDVSSKKNKKKKQEDGLTGSDITPNCFPSVITHSSETMKALDLSLFHLRWNVPQCCESTQPLFHAITQGSLRKEVTKETCWDKSKVPLYSSISKLYRHLNQFHTPCQKILTEHILVVDTRYLFKELDMVS